MSLKSSFVASLVASAALWAAPALAEDSYRTVQPHVASRPASPSPMHTVEDRAAPAIGGSGMMPCEHMAAQGAHGVEHACMHDRAAESRPTAGGQSLYPTSRPEPLRP